MKVITDSDGIYVQLNQRERQTLSRAAQILGEIDRRGVEAAGDQWKISDEHDPARRHLVYGEDTARAASANGYVQVAVLDDDV